MICDTEISDVVETFADQTVASGCAVDNSDLELQCTLSDKERQARRAWFLEAQEKLKKGQFGRISAEELARYDQLTRTIIELAETNSHAVYDANGHSPLIFILSTLHSHRCSNDLAGLLIGMLDSGVIRPQDKLLVEGRFAEKNDRGDECSAQHVIDLRQYFFTGPIPFAYRAEDFAERGVKIHAFFQSKDPYEDTYRSAHFRDVTLYLPAMYRFAREQLHNPEGQRARMFFIGGYLHVFTRDITNSLTSAGINYLALGPNYFDEKRERDEIIVRRRKPQMQ